MFRLWGKEFKENRLLRDTVICDETTDTRTHKIFNALDAICYEFDLSKPIGCSLGNIRQMFLLEAAFIGLGGGVIGNVLSFLMSAAINALVKGKEMGMTTGQISYIPLWLVLVSLGFAMLVGTAAGYFPARRAMKLSPLAAIRNE